MKAEQARFLEWARASLVQITAHRDDLAALTEMIGDATIVALAEAVHFGAEPLAFRNRVFRHLVEEQGFTAIAIESGIVEGCVVHDYVRGGPGELPTVVAGGIGWTFDRLPQNKDLVRWLREYNADPQRARRINFYGFDVPGSPTNTSANRGADTALVEALEYLDRADGAAGAAFRGRLDPLLKNLKFDVHRAAAAPGYDLLSPSERDALSAAIADLIVLLERREARYLAASTTADYEWAHRAAIGARQVDAFLRQIPIGWQPANGDLKFPSEHTSFLAAANDVRDRAQVDNLDWIVRREGPDGKILVHASCYHLSTQPVRFAWSQDWQEVAGTYLRRRFGDRLVAIGNMMGQCGPGCAGIKGTTQHAPADSIDGLLAQLGVPLFLLDLRTAPVGVAEWLAREHLLWQGQGVLQVALGGAFDILFYVDAVTAAGSG